MGQRQLVEVAQQAGLQQARQGGQHAAPADGRGGGEARGAPVERPQAGCYAARRVVRRAAARGGGVTPVAVFLAGGRRRRRTGRRAAGLRARSLSVTVTLGGRAGAAPWQALAGR